MKKRETHNHASHLASALMRFCLSPGLFLKIIPCRKNYPDMLTMPQELNIDCFQGYGNSCGKDYHKANNGMKQDTASHVCSRLFKLCNLSRMNFLVCIFEWPYL